MNGNWSRFFGSPTNISTFTSNKKHKNKIKNTNRVDRNAFVACAHCNEFSNSDITITMQQRLLWDHQINFMYPITQSKIIKTLKGDIPKHDIDAEIVCYNVIDNEVVKPTSRNAVITPYDQWKQNNPATTLTHQASMTKRKAKMIEVIKNTYNIMRIIQNNSDCLRNVHISISDIVPNTQSATDNNCHGSKYSSSYTNSDDSNDNASNNYSYNNVTTKKINHNQVSQSDSQRQTDKNKNENKQSKNRIKSGKKEIDDSSEEDSDTNNNDTNDNINSDNDGNQRCSSEIASPDSTDTSTTTLTSIHHLNQTSITSFMIVSNNDSGNENVSKTNMTETKKESDSIGNVTQSPANTESNLRKSNVGRSLFDMPFDTSNDNDINEIYHSYNHNQDTATTSHESQEILNLKQRLAMLESENIALAARMHEHNEKQSSMTCHTFAEIAHEYKSQGLRMKTIDISFDELETIEKKQFKHESVKTYLSINSNKFKSKDDNIKLFQF